MDHYKFLIPTIKDSFDYRLNELKEILSSYLHQEHLSGFSLSYVKIFLSDAQNQYQQLVESELFQTLASSTAVTIIEQPPLDGSKISLLIKTANEPEHCLFQSIRLTEAETRGASAYVQTITLFEKYLQSVEDKGIDMATHLVRTWIYVADIDVNYEGVVKARNDIFQKYGLTIDTHYIASTGIGAYTQTRSAAVGIDFLTYPNIEEHDKKYLQALDHLNPTHEYGVAFERGILLRQEKKEIAFISGTASIDKHGDVLYLGDVKKQTIRLLENIKALLADGGLSMDMVNYYVIYLRDPSDFSIINNYMTKHFPNIPFIVVLGKVCRPEWLIEMECTATRYI